MSFFAIVTSSKLRVTRRTLTSNLQLTLSDTAYQLLSSTQNYQVILPAAPIVGIFFEITNIGNSQLTIKENAETTILILGSQEGYRKINLIYDGQEWHGYSISGANLKE